MTESTPVGSQSFAPTGAPEMPAQTVPTIREAAEKLHAQLTNDAEWRKSYLGGSAEKFNQLQALSRIRTADPGVPDEQLADLEKAAGIVRLPPTPPAPEPVSPLIAATAKPTDYRPQWGEFARGLPSFPDITDGLTSWASAMQFTSGLGTAIVERIADMSPKLAFKMSDSERASWEYTQNRLLLNRAGSPEAVEALRADAQKALAEIGGGHSWSKVIGESRIMNDAWFLQTLANHWRAHPRGGRRAA